MAKGLLFKEESRAKVFAGIEQVANAVKSTLGPKGRLVMIDKPFGSPLITKDGVSVAREIELEDKFENLGAQILKEVASKTNDIAGDGSTTSTVLAYSILKNGMKAVSNGVSPVELKNGIREGVKQALEKIDANKREVASKEDIINVATVSSNWDNELGKMIGEAIYKIGKDGVITVKDSNTLETTVEYVEGVQIERGYISPFFITDKEKAEVDFDNPYILLCNDKISSISEILHIVEETAEKKAPLVIIADDIEGEALQVLSMNALRGTLKVVAIKSPGMGENKRANLQDLATVTGGRVVDSEMGITLGATGIENLGRANNIKVTKNTTTIISDNNKDAIKDRIKTLKACLETLTSEYDIKNMKDRISKLVGGVAVINVGANSELELKELKHRVEDTLSATKAAVETGIVAGGGIALLNASATIKPKKDFTFGEQVGFDILKEALQEPFKQIVGNAGFNGDVLIEKLKDLDIETGVDAYTGKFTDMFEAGIIDPHKVTMNALKNASSITALVLNTDCIIVDTSKEETNNNMIM